MNPDEHETLSALEYLMEEFFNPLTTNCRKHEIELELQSFKRLPHLWHYCLFFVTNTSSQYVRMFALSTLETVIDQQWTEIDWSSKQDMKIVFHSFLVEKAHTDPHFIRLKYAKLLVAIAKQEWPRQYPSFFNDILELLKIQRHQLVGLLLLRTASEEFMGLGATFENGRKDEIARLLHHYIPIAFGLLNTILENLGSKPRHTSTATPPPSPTHPTSSTPSSLSHEFSAKSAAQHCCSSTSLCRNKTDPKAVNKEALNTVQHLFTWVDIGQIPPGIIKAIFNFTNISSYAQDDHDMCVLAMSTINELLYRKCAPPGSQDFFIQLYCYTLELLRDITSTASSSMDNLDPTFIEKLTELLNLIVEQHLWRMEMEPQFSALEFLSLLFQLTVHLPSIQCYLKCLSVWATFFRHMKIEKCEKYSEAFLGLLTALLKKIQFSMNADQLKEINNVETNEDNETEWQIFLKTTIEIIYMIAECAPLQTLSHVLIPWENFYNFYCRLESIVDQQSFTLNCDSIESERLCHILTDYSSLTQILARLSPLFTDQENEDIQIVRPLVNSLTEKLLKSASLATLIRSCSLKVNSPKVAQCFVDNHSQLLASIETYLSWMRLNDKSSMDLLKLLVNLTLPMMATNSIPLKISNSSAHLFLALSNTQYAPNLVLLQEIVQFIHLSKDLKFEDNQTHLVIYSAITNLLLKPWPECTEQNSNHRNHLIDGFFEGLTWEFRQLSNSTRQERVRQVTQNVLPSLSHIVDFSKGLPIASKKRLCQAIKSTTDHALYLFPIFAKDVEVSSCILMFFLNVLRVLQQQLGVDGTKCAVQTFLDVAIKEQEPSNFLDKLLQIFQLVVESTGTTYKIFLPGILQLCMDNVYPYILTQSNEDPDTFLALLSLLHSILLHRWQYFHSSQVRLGYSPIYDGGNSEQDEAGAGGGGGSSQMGAAAAAAAQPPEPSQLLVVLQVFGQALLQPDINIFKLSLASLEDLNTKWKLYHNVLYRYNSLSKYLNVLMQTLVNKSHSILAEDIHAAIYNMASVNFDYFLTAFLPEFSNSIQGLPSVLVTNFVMNHDKDMPTFVRNLRIFVNDVQQFAHRTA